MERTDSWDLTSVYYPQLADILKITAEKSSHVIIGDATNSNWRQVMGLMREVDTYADTPGVSQVAVLGELQSFDRFRERYPRLGPDANVVVREKLVSRAEKILVIGEHIAHAIRPEDYINLRLDEADHTAELFSDSADDSVLEQSAFRGSFIPLLKTMSRAACMLDSAVDVGQDQRDGKSIIEPTLALRLQMLCRASYYGVPFTLAYIQHPSILPHIFHAAELQYQRKRLRHKK